MRIRPRLLLAITGDAALIANQASMVDLYRAEGVIDGQAVIAYVCTVDTR